MKLHGSIVKTESDAELRLPGNFSEWLFASSFWSDFNRIHGTFFDQFEEDEVESKYVTELIKALDKKIHILNSLPDINIEFIHGWTSEQRPLKVSASKDAFLTNLSAFKIFLVQAAANGGRIYLSL